MLKPNRGKNYFSQTQNSLKRGKDLYFERADAKGLLHIYQNAMSATWEAKRSGGLSGP